MPSLLHARRQVALASIAGIGINRPAADAPLAPRLSGSQVSGVSFRVQADAGITTASLAAGAARAALRAARAEPAEIDMILVGTTTPDVLWPSTACLVQTELKLPMVFALDLYAAQASFLTALNVGSHYVAAGYKGVLLIGADCDRQLVDLPGQGGLVHAHAAAAAILRPAEDGSGILATTLGGAARGAANGGQRPEAERREIAGVVDQCLGKAGLRLADIDLVVAEQSLPELMREWARHSGARPQALLLEPKRYGSLLAAAPLAVLHDAARAGRLTDGMSVLVLECGAGPVWAAACLRWNAPGVAEC